MTPAYTVDDFSFFVDSSKVTVGEKNIVEKGTHTISETGPTEFFTTTFGDDCDDLGSIDLKKDERATCTITNTYKGKGTLQIKKVLVGAPTTVTPDTFSYQINNGSAVFFESDGQNDVELVPGTYSVTEVPATDFTTTYSNCSDLVLANGETVTCTITNTYKTPEPKVCTVTITSDETNTVREKTGAFAKVLTVINGGWTAVIENAKWIWGDDPVVDPTTTESQTFEKNFYWNGPVLSATLEIASDNSHAYNINGVTGGDTREQNFKLPGDVTTSQDTYTLDDTAIQQGINSLAIKVENIGVPDSNAASNPAGLLYKLTIVGSDENCGQAPVVPETKDIKICKKDADKKPLAWDMTVSNGEGGKSYPYTTSSEDGCVTASVDPTKGPWTVTEATDPAWKLIGVTVLNGSYLYEGTDEKKIGCRFFNDTSTNSVTTAPEYICTFVNEFKNNGNNDSSSSSHGGGSCANCGANNDNDDDRDGGTRGSSDDRDNNDSDEDDKKPEGEVEGAQTTKVPAVAGASTGAGGTSSSNGVLPFMALTTILASAILFRTTKVNEM